MKPKFEFTLILSGPTDITSEVENGLFESGCDDATLSLQNGVLKLTFTRSADSLKEAILSATQDVQKAGIAVVGLEVGGQTYASDDIGFASEIG